MCSQRFSQWDNGEIIDRQVAYLFRYGRSVLNLRACNIIIRIPSRKPVDNTPIPGFKCSQASRYNGLPSVLVDTKAEEWHGMA